MLVFKELNKGYSSKMVSSLVVIALPWDVELLLKSVLLYSRDASPILPG